MRKKFLIFSIVCLLFCTLSYTYSSFKNTIVGNISGNIKDWVFKVSIDNSTKYEDGYKLHLTGTSGSFNININTVGGASGADYSIELIGDSSIKYYTDCNYTKLIDNNIYKGSINSNTSNSVTITDIITVPCKTIETAHNPYPNSQSNVVLGEFTFENAKS